MACVPSCGGGVSCKGARLCNGMHNPATSHSLAHNCVCAPMCCAVAAGNVYAEQLSFWAAYAVAFVVRPIGALAFGA